MTGHVKQTSDDHIFMIVITLTRPTAARLIQDVRSIVDSISVASTYPIEQRLSLLSVLDEPLRHYGKH